MSVPGMATSRDVVIRRIALQSLSLLGFKAEEYSKDFTHLKVKSLDASTFDKSNERALMVTLHFLLSSMRPQFAVDAAPFWPYGEVSVKNEFKLVVDRYLDQFVAVNIITSNLCRTSVISAARGPIVWKLLWKLSSTALQEQCEVGGRESPVAETAEELRDQLRTEYEGLITENTAVIRRQRQQHQYSEELHSRFKAARKNIERLRRAMQALESDPNFGPALTASGRVERTRMLVRIEGAVPALTSALQSRGFTRLQNLCRSDQIGCSSREDILSVRRELSQYLDSVASEGRNNYDVSGNELNVSLKSRIEKLRQVSSSATLSLPPEEINLTSDVSLSDILLLNNKDGVLKLQLDCERLVRLQNELLFH
jgi:hypothetical protein